MGTHIFHTFWHLIIEVTPYFFLGIGFSALLEVYIKTDFLYKLLDQGNKSVVYTTLLGAILPGCACATIPMAESIKSKGGNLGTLTSFIMVSPLLGPHTIILTYGLLGSDFTIARVLFSIIGAITLGLLTNVLANKKKSGFNHPQPHNNAIKNNTCCHTEKQDNHHHNPRFLHHFFHLTKKLGPYFLVGISIASLLTALMPPTLIPKYVGSSGSLAYGLALIGGIPMYVCEAEEIPITLSLLSVGLGPGPALTFMLGAVGTCIPTMLMAQKIIGKKPTLLYVGCWFIFALSAGLLFDWLF